MAVFRVERNKGYTVMSNHHLRNKELSLKAVSYTHLDVYKRQGVRHPLIGQGQRHQIRRRAGSRSGVAAAG